METALVPALEEALLEAERKYVESNPRSRERFDEACQSMPGGNTRSVLFYSPFPVTFARGEGSHLWDLDGHQYVDLLGEYSAGLYGHSHPVIMEAIRSALCKGIVLGGPNEFEARLARLVCERFPSCEMVRFCNSGTEANLMAIAAARTASRRKSVLVFDGSYHGGVLNFAHGESPANAPFPFILAPYNDREGTLAVIEHHAADIAAILVEPMMGAGGGIPAQPGFLDTLREAANRNRIVLIFDEVMTSRFAGGGAQGRLGIVPDLTSFGKYMGGGLGFGGFGGRRDLMALYDPRRPDSVEHAGTFNNNVLTMAAGVAGLSEVFTAEAAERLHARGDRMRERINALGSKHGVLMRATGAGSIMSVHFQRGSIKRPADVTTSPPALRALFHLEMLMAGYYFARRGYISVSLAVSGEQIDGFIGACEWFIGKYRTLMAN